MYSPDNEAAKDIEALRTRVTELTRKHDDATSENRDLERRMAALIAEHKDFRDKNKDALDSSVNGSATQAAKIGELEKQLSALELNLTDVRRELQETLTLTRISANDHLRSERDALSQRLQETEDKLQLLLANDSEAGVDGGAIRDSHAFSITSELDKWERDRAGMPDSLPQPAAQQNYIRTEHRGQHSGGRPTVSKNHHIDDKKSMAMAGSRLGGMMKPPVIVLREGTDTSQGTPQLLSNITACQSIVSCVASTLGPRGMDKLIVNDKGQATISNDGATILKLLEIVHPAAKMLVDIARAQDAEVGDGTTSVVLLAGEFLKESRTFIEDGVSPHIIIKGYRKAAQMAIDKVNEIAVTIDPTDKAAFRDLLMKCAGTSMNSKLIVSQRDFFMNMVVETVTTLDQNDLDESLIGVKRVAGDPKVLCLNVELELKAEKDNAEVRINEVSEYQAIVDAEWQIIYSKLEAIVKTGAKVVLSKLPIGDLATQYFADRDIFCAGRVAADDLRRVTEAVGGSVQSTCSEIKEEHLGAQQFIAEVERSLHDAIMVVKRAIKNNSVVAGGGATEMEVSRYLREYAKTIHGKQQLIIAAFAKALEIIPRQLSDNAGFEATDVLNKLRMRHAQGHKWDGVDVENEGVTDCMASFVWEPALIKINALSSACEGRLRHPVR
ncbi:hypothetical protein IEQ34_025543 [Dendrobium chrysotoxum]|uniref:CCT-eta n=1 Tax=Dendrobium chrysotoxum TaxID=161865 RepID=A0AAV7FQH9_DENCH|nr:hypothetical protein IEQ34_025543 [Dendrobium chrysotoxum]